MICSNAREGDHADDVRAAAVFADFCGTDEMGSTSVVPTVASIMASLSAAASFLCAAALAASDARYSASVIIAGEVLRTMDFVVEGGLATHHVAAYCNEKRQSASFIIRRAFALADTIRYRSRALWTPQSDYVSFGNWNSDSGASDQERSQKKPWVKELTDVPPWRGCHDTCHVSVPFSALSERVTESRIPEQNDLEQSGRARI